MIALIIKPCKSFRNFLTNFLMKNWRFLRNKFFLFDFIITFLALVFIDLWKFNIKRWCSQRPRKSESESPKIPEKRPLWRYQSGPASGDVGLLFPRIPGKLAGSVQPVRRVLQRKGLVVRGLGKRSALDARCLQEGGGVILLNLT